MIANHEQLLFSSVDDNGQNKELELAEKNGYNQDVDVLKNKFTDMCLVMTGRYI